jgi:hypothetical protein
MRLQTSPEAHRPSVRRRTKALRDRENLKKDLATYATHAERIELAAILERAEPGDAAYVREILDQVPTA